jgi:hypothetical protein
VEWAEDSCLGNSITDRYKRANFLTLAGTSQVAYLDGHPTAFERYCNVAYSAFARFKIGMSGSASFQRSSKSS